MALKVGAAMRDPPSETSSTHPSSTPQDTKLALPCTRPPPALYFLHCAFQETPDTSGGHCGERTQHPPPHLWVPLGPRCCEPPSYLLVRPQHLGHPVGHHGLIPRHREAAPKAVAWAGACLGGFGDIKPDHLLDLTERKGREGPKGLCPRLCLPKTRPWGAPLLCPPTGPPQPPS